MQAFVLNSLNECQWTAIAQDGHQSPSLDAVAMVGSSHWTRLKMEEGEKLLIFTSKASKWSWKFIEADNVKCSGLVSTRIVRPGVFLHLRQEMVSNQAVALKTFAPRGVDQPFGEAIASFSNILFVATVTFRLAHPRNLADIQAIFSGCKDCVFQFRFDAFACGH